MLNKTKLSNKKFHSSVIENYDKKFFHEKLFSVLKKFENKKSKSNRIFLNNFERKKMEKLFKFLSFSKNLILEKKIAIDLINKIDPNLLLSKSYKDKKFTSLQKQEIIKSINNFKKINKKKYKIYISRLTKDCFYLSKLKNSKKLSLI